MASVSTLLERLVLLVMVLHLVVCPYTKVEESFNLQAMHDIIFHGLNISQYDHLEFPGVVPRTFLGPLLVSLMAYPFVTLAMHAGFSKFAAQYIVRFMLGLFVLCSFIKFKRAVASKLGQGVGKWLLVITASQFHILFYMSRPLPNTFALALVLLAVQFWLKQEHKLFIWASGCSVIVFRAETAMLLGLLLLVELWNRRISLGNIIVYGVPTAVFWLGLSVMVDSYFWQRPLWAEGEVLWYNVILNKSSNWGTSPFLWYAYSALPRALSASLLFIPLGLYLDNRAWSLLLPSAIFVGLYSLLPHKELRFIIYVFPLLNTVAAMACSRLWQNKRKSIFRFLLALGALGHLAINIGTTCQFLYVAHLNYPGGLAIKALHDLVPPSQSVHVHIDVPTAQTGVSRFTQLHQHWRYNKTEGLLAGGPDMLAYTHLFVGISEATEDPTEIKPYRQTHKVMKTIQGFSRLRFKGRDFPPLEVVKEPKIYLLQKK